MSCPRTLLLFCCCILLVEVAFGLTLGCFVQSEMVVALPLYRFLPLFGNRRKEGRKKMWNLEAFLEPFQCPEREASVVASQTLLVYAPFEQRLNGECSSPLCIQL